ncbi:selenide, water dikinase SelD [Cyanobium sp. CH-040]|nr:selenide, water dikinase SelD [Cyanobium sp. CH-040]
MPSPPPAGHLVLAGGGHTHALVLLRWAMAARRGRPRTGGALVTLVSRASTALYSGMVPGLLAGIYDREACAIDLRRLCRQAGATFIAAEITGLHPQERTLELEGRPALHWDWLSLDVGAETALPAGPGPAAAGAPPAQGVKPLEPFLAWAEARLSETAGREAHAPGLAIRGGGAAGVEVALALQGRGLRPELLLRGEQLHLGTPAANRLGERLLAAAAIPVRRQAGPGQQAALACTGSRAPLWLGAAGLPTDSSGRVRTEATLQVLGQPRLFASGDCGVIAAAPRPASGVWAVRAAPTLATNLERCLIHPQAAAPSGLRRWRPQRRALQLLADGSRPDRPRAIALWGPLALGPSRLLWRWKDRIDRRFMARFALRRPMATGAGSEDAAAAMACRGCAAKLAGATLAAGLRQAGVLGQAEDAAVIGRRDNGELLLQSVDGFPALVDDPWLNARLTTLHACSDLWACGARVTSAQALVTLPQAAPRLQQEWLAHTLAGIASVLEPLGASLLGGHTVEGRDGAGLGLGLSVNGAVAPERHWSKGPLQPGQVLLLTRPLGTGVLFASAMAGTARAAWIDAALEQMQHSQADLVEELQALGCRACTDITGFGLLGHLAEMLAASTPGLRVELDAAALPTLPGALELLEGGLASSLAPANAAALALLEGPVRLSEPPGPADAAARRSARLGLLIDPQTCGPLLAALPAGAGEAAIAALRRRGFAAAAVVGRVEQPPGLGE